MGRIGFRAAVVVFGVLVAVAAVAGWRQAPDIAAYALVRPARRPPPDEVPADCAAARFNGAGITLSGWRCRSDREPRATMILLHGIADNRASWRGVIPRFTRTGYEVIAYDSRAHGASEGDWCTYGYLEKDDLRRVLDVLPPRPVILFGTSLGAAIALQAAAADPRVTGVIAVETFSDLRTVAIERAPFFLTTGVIRQAFEVAEARGRFSVDAVSPVHDASRITIPVLLIHGAADVETPADHSRRVFAALAGPKQLLIVPGAGHNHSLGDASAWREIDAWLSQVLDAQTSASRSGPNRPAK